MCIYLCYIDGDRRRRSNIIPEEVYPIHEMVTIKLDDGILPKPFNVEDYLSHFKRHRERRSFDENVNSINRYALFILDGSGSITKENFDVMLNFTAELAFVFQHCGFSALVIYDHCTYLKYNFNNFTDHTYETYTNLIDCIMNTNYPDGWTASGYAIRKAYEEVLKKITGKIEEIDILFITDGHSNRGESPCQEARYYWKSLLNKTANVHIYPIGIGNYINHTELQCIMGDSPEVDHPLHVLNFTMLHNIAIHIIDSLYSNPTRFCAKFDNYQEMICEYATGFAPWTGNVTLVRYC